MLPGISKVLLTRKFQQLCYRGAMALFLLILVVGSLPGARDDIGQYASGIVLHALAYGVLAGLFFVGSSGSALARAIKAALTVATMGALDEYVQSFFPYRTAAIGDWMVDVAAGSLVSAALREFWGRLGSHQEDNEVTHD